MRNFRSVSTRHSEAVSATQMSDLQQYRQKAEECRQHALVAQSPEEKAMWLQVAQEWEKLAERAESERPH
jgi:hypothetical protein